jgi:predicted amidohydrolase
LTGQPPHSVGAPDRLRVLALQAELKRYAPLPNMHYLRDAVERAAQAEPIDLVVLPECFNGTTLDDYEPQAARDARGFVPVLARSASAYVVGGSIEYRDADGRGFNACLIADRNGELIGEYHKQRPFALEQDRITPGKELFDFSLDGVRVGVLICADLWDAQLARELAGRVDLLAVPAHTGVPSVKNIEYARLLWHNLALTRAMENGVAVVVSDWCEGRFGSHYTAGGASIVDPGCRPDAKALQKCFPRGEPGTLAATIDLQRLRAYREYRRAVGLLPERPDAPAKP